ncbi:MAG TPA: hypothetical protein VMU43_02420 [Candidatus Acidoferrum sp.]|nr:hypothetical protein [Candidatus Acidoferrum sp.]
MRCARETQHGGAKLNLLFTLFFLGSMVFVAFKIFPPYIANYQLQDAMGTEARFAIVNRKSAQDVQDDIWKKIQELGIPATEDAVVVTGQGGAVTISVNYSVPIDLIVYKFDMQFHPTADNHTI